jgi:cell division protein FtsQ
MARKKPENAAVTRLHLGGIVVRSIIGLAILAGGMFTFHRLERFLIQDERFQFAVPPEYGADPPGLRIAGVARASRKAVLQTFQPDFGTSVYLIPLDQRRAQLMKIEWVRSATIARIWPNELVVRMEERNPVAFFETSSGRSKVKIMMIDEDGTLLAPPGQVKFRLPVITGFRAEDPLKERRERVLRMMRLMKDIKEYATRVSEVNTEDMDNLKAIVEAPNARTADPNRRALLLWLGDRNFHQRIEDFDRSYPEIRRKLPDATMLDLRLDGRISVVGGKGD